jgi:hypothetical protein
MPGLGDINFDMLLKFSTGRTFNPYNLTAANINALLQLMKNKVLGKSEFETF